MSMALETLHGRNSSPLSAVIVQQGRLLDYIDGLTQRKETPEEYVRQEIAKSIVREYGYDKSQIAVEYVVRVGAGKPRADLVIFGESESHSQDKARIIIECKSQKIKSSDRKEGVGQLQSYMSACPNVSYGMWTNGLERFCFRRIDHDGIVSFEEIPDIPGKGKSDDEVERPRFDQLKAASSDALLFAFRRCHNYIAGNQGLQKPEAFWELLKIIFAKLMTREAPIMLTFMSHLQSDTALMASFLQRSGSITCLAKSELNIRRYFVRKNL